MLIKPRFTRGEVAKYQADLLASSAIGLQHLGRFGIGPGRKVGALVQWGSAPCGCGRQVFLIARQRGVVAWRKGQVALVELLCDLVGMIASIVKAKATVA